MAEEGNAQDLDFNKILQRVVIGSLHLGLLAKGIHEVCKSIETKKAKFVVLAKNCTEQHYTKLVKALCKENQIPLLLIEEGETLGEWIGICKYDLEKNIKKRKKCTSLAIKEYPAEIREEEIQQIEKRF